MSAVMLAITLGPAVWFYAPLLLAWLSSCMWLALRWMVPQVDWVKRNPYSESRCGPQSPGDAVRFVWYDTVENTHLPMLEIIEPKHPRDRRDVAEMMGQKLAPFAHDAVIVM